MARKKADSPSQDMVEGLARSEVGGRYLSTYDPSLALQIIERIAEGETLNAICRGQAGMPHPTTFRRWMVNNPELAQAYKVAVTISATSLEEEALDAARNIALKQRDGTQVRAVEVKIRQLQWSAERRDAAKFGNRAQVSVRVPIQIITPLNLGQGSTASIPDIYTLDAKVLKSPDEAEPEGADPKQIVEEKPILHGGHRKLKLTPPSGQRINNTFQKIMRGEGYERQDVRSSGGGSGDREGNSRPGDEKLHLQGGETGLARQEESSSAAEDTESGGEGE